MVIETKKIIASIFMVLFVQLIQGQRAEIVCLHSFRGGGYHLRILSVSVLFVSFYCSVSSDVRENNHQDGQFFQSVL